MMTGTMYLSAMRQASMATQKQSPGVAAASTGTGASELRPNTRLVVVNAPHNPTGMLPSHAEWRALTDLCAEAGVRLLSDEATEHRQT